MLVKILNFESPEDALRAGAAGGTLVKISARIGEIFCQNRTRTSEKSANRLISLNSDNPETFGLLFAY